MMTDAEYEMYSDEDMEEYFKELEKEETANI